MLLEAAHNAGVITNEQYAEFQNAGYMGLYGRLTVEDIHKRKNLNDKVRKAIEDIGGTMPEDLPRPEKSIKQIEKEQLKRLKDKKTKLMLDE